MVQGLSPERPIVREVRLRERRREIRKLVVIA